MFEPFGVGISDVFITEAIIYIGAQILTEIRQKQTKTIPKQLTITTLPKTLEILLSGTVNKAFYNIT